MATLGIPSNTIEVLQKYHFNFQKKFGQNFLIDTHVLEKIMNAAQISKDDCVVEVGPGIGTMTQYLTTPIIMGLFESHVPLQSITIMVQKEVADRMQVGPGTKDYGALSLAVQYYAKPEIVANVPPNCFIPRPNVGSAVIRLDRYAEPPVQTADEQFMFSVIRASFNQRRKTLVNGLSNAPGLNVSKEKIKEVLARMKLSETVRGETLTLEQFAQLADLLRG